MIYDFFKDWYGAMKSDGRDEPYPFTPVKKLRNIKVALVIGHKKTSQGAYNRKHDMSEYRYNEKLILEIEDNVPTNIDIHKVYRRTYNSLPDDINELNPDFIISFHCNAFNEHASGTETLYYHKSEKSKKMAKIINDRMVGILRLKDRGIKPKTSEDRGGYLLKNTHAPCVIIEPFFIDNNSDLEIATMKNTIFVDMFVTTIMKIAEDI